MYSALFVYTFGFMVLLYVSSYNVLPKLIANTLVLMFVISHIAGRVVNALDYSNI